MARISNLKMVLGLGCVLGACTASETRQPPTTAAPTTPAPEATPSASPDKSDLIRVTEPAPGAVMKSPFRVTGEARGKWYFEASFPVTLLDASGKPLVRTHAQALGEWMTESFVPFESTLQFAVTTEQTGTLVLEKDNPSGEPQHADEIRIPVRLSP